MTRRHLSPRERLRLFTAAGGVCHICGGKIDGTREAWDIEHVIPLAMGGADDDTNMRPAHKVCHAPKTADDLGRLAKAKRQQLRHLGIKRARAVIPGSRVSRWKRKLDGTTVLRDGDG